MSCRCRWNGAASHTLRRARHLLLLPRAWNVIIGDFINVILFLGNCYRCFPRRDKGSVTLFYIKITLADIYMNNFNIRPMSIFSRLVITPVISAKLIIACYRYTVFPCRTLYSCIIVEKVNSLSSKEAFDIIISIFTPDKWRQYTEIERNSIMLWNDSQLRFYIFTRPFIRTCLCYINVNML